MTKLSPAQDALLKRITRIGTAGYLLTRQEEKTAFVLSNKGLITVDYNMIARVVE